MNDREKVIEWLDFCIRNTDGSICECEMSGCPYLGGSDVGNCFATLMNDALVLLKAQEPMLVKHTTSTIRCPKCNKQITSRGAIHKEIKYCWKCGQAVKWE